MILTKKIEMTDLRTISASYKSLLTTKNEAQRIRILKKILLVLQEDEIIPFIQIVLGYKKSSLITIKKLMTWCIEYKAIPGWMLTTCHTVTGDWIETLSLILGNPSQPGTAYSFTNLLEKISFFRISKKEEEIKSWLLREWDLWSSDELYLIFKLFTGTFKAVISKQIVSKLIHELFGSDPLLILHRLNELHFNKLTFDQLINRSWSADELESKPYPFIEPEVIALSSFHFGNMEDWIVEPFVYGTRIQIYRFDSGLKISNEDRDHLSPDDIDCIQELNLLPVNTVIEVLMTGESNSEYFILDIHRWNEKEKNQLGSVLSRKDMVMEWLKKFQINHLQIMAHETLSTFSNTTYHHTNENRIIKHIYDDRRYRIKPEASSLFAALLYAEYINQNTSIQYILTLGVFHQDQQLIPIARVSSDQMSDMDKNELNYWIQNNTIQKFGPVRVVRSGKIICISYERVQKNKRVKSGITLIHVNIIKILNQSSGLISVSSINEIKGAL